MRTALGTPKIACTVRYLGIEVDRAIEIVETIDVRQLVLFRERTWSAIAKGDDHGSVDFRFLGPTGHVQRTAPYPSHGSKLCLT